MWLVWRDHEDRDDAIRVSALDASGAAGRAGSLFHAHRDGWEWTWPIDVIVEHFPSGDRYAITVNREIVPEFWTGRPRYLGRENANEENQDNKQNGSQD